MILTLVWMVKSKERLWTSKFSSVVEPYHIWRFKWCLKADEDQSNFYHFNTFSINVSHESIKICLLKIHFLGLFNKEKVE